MLEGLLRVSGGNYNAISMSDCFRAQSGSRRATWATVAERPEPAGETNDFQIA